MKNHTRPFLILFLFLMLFSGCNDRTKKDTKTEVEKTNDPQELLSGIDRTNFERSIDEKSVKLYVLKNKDGLEAVFSNYGQRLISLMVPDKNGVLDDIVLGYTALDQYMDGNGGYFGAIIGRYGNRIAQGKFEIDGVSYQLAQNNNGNHLHGGVKGFESVVWEVDSVAQNYISFKRISPDMEEGYPGNLKINVEYTLTDDNELRIVYTGVTDKKTHVNLTHHSFFNLKGEGSGTINDHLLQINAASITAVDAELIPTGLLMPVKNTPFDFNTPKTIQAGLNGQHEQLTMGNGFDHNYVLDPDLKNEEGLFIAAKVREPQSGRVMEVFTNEPGLQFYGGNFLDGKTRGKKGGIYEFRGAFCLESQHYPNSPNQKNFPSTLLEPGVEYKSICIYKFTVE